MTKGPRGSVTDIAMVFLVAAVVGLSWNHTLLLSAWRGEATSAPAVAAPAAAQGTQDATPLPLGLMQVKEMYDANEAAIVDARDAETYAAGHVKGAVSLPLGEAVNGIPASFKTAVPSGKEVVVYCNGFSCHDSMQLGELLLKSGYRTVYVYEGGFPEWHDAGYPVEEGRKS